MKRAEGQAGKIGCLGLIGVTGVIVFVVLTIAGVAEDRRARSGGQIYDDLDAQIGCEELVKDSLMSPGSAKFPGPFSGEYAEVEDQGTHWAYASYVDSENRFGATLRTHFRCKFTKAGEASVEFD